MKIFLFACSFLVFIGSYFSQNKKTLLNEINKHRSKVYKNSTYKIENSQLKDMVYQYMRASGYSYSNKSDSLCTVYYKDIYLASPNIIINCESTGYKESVEKSCVRIYYTEDIIGSIKIEIFQRVEDGDPAFSRVCDKRTLGRYSFNDYGLHKYIYHKNNVEEIIYPEYLLDNIRVYNEKQIKPKKFIKKGRDY